MKRSIVLVFLGFLLTGCGSSTSTHGPPLPSEGRQSTTPTAETKNWFMDRKTNPIDGIQTITVTANAKNGSNGALIIRFTGKKLDAYIITGEVVDDENASIRIKFDDDVPIKQTWSRSADYTAVFSPDSFGLLTRLQRSSRFYIEYHPYQKVSETITFDVAGLSSALPQAEMAAQKKKYDDISVANTALRARVLLHVHKCSQKKNDGSLMYPGQWCWSDPNADIYRSDLLPFPTKEEAIRNAIETARTGVVFKK